MLRDGVEDGVRVERFRWAEGVESIVERLRRRGSASKAGEGIEAVEGAFEVGDVLVGTLQDELEGGVGYLR